MKCKSCGVPFSEHIGVQGLCEQNTVMRQALRQISEPYNEKWYKSADDGYDVVDRMIEIANRALNDSGGGNCRK